MQNPVLAAASRRIFWVMFAVLFFYSGLYFTQWLLQPDAFSGGPFRGLLAASFPFLLPLSFFVNKRLGCAAGSCRARRYRAVRTGDDREKIRIMRMPGA